jgi:hypothetical protein
MWRWRILLNKVMVEFFSNADADGLLVDKNAFFHLVQSTFCLHNLPPSSRKQLFAWIYQHCDEFLIVEFDVSDEIAYSDNLGSQLHPLRFLRLFHPFFGQSPKLISSHDSDMIEKYLKGIEEYQRLPTCPIVVKVSKKPQDQNNSEELIFSIS